MPWIHRSARPATYTRPHMLCSLFPSWNSAFSLEDCSAALEQHVRRVTHGSRPPIPEPWRGAPNSHPSPHHTLLSLPPAPALFRWSLADPPHALPDTPPSRCPRAGCTLLVARGSTAQPVFERVAVPAQQASGEAPVISLQPSEGNVLLKAGGGTAKTDGSKSKLQHSRNDVTVLGPENAGQPVLTRAVGDASAAGRKRAEPEADGGADEEEGERLRLRAEPCSRGGP